MSTAQPCPYTMAAALTLGKLNNVAAPTPNPPNTEGEDFTFETFFPSGEKKMVARSKAKTNQENKFPVEPRVIQVIKKPRSYMNHSYRDFSGVPPEVDDDDFPEEIEKMTFVQKVWHILAQSEYTKIISWVPHGRAFRIHVPTNFEKYISQKYFGHKRFSSFLRQLSNHGFKHISQGADRNCYYHEFMLRGMPHLCKYFGPPKDARRLIPDPENELDFYALSEKYPVPGGEPAMSIEKPAAAMKKTEPKPAKNIQVQQTSGAARLASEVAWKTAAEPPAKKTATEFLRQLQKQQLRSPEPLVAPLLRSPEPLLTAPFQAQPTRNVSDLQASELLLQMSARQTVPAPVPEVATNSHLAEKLLMAKIVEARLEMERRQQHLQNQFVNVDAILLATLLNSGNNNSMLPRF